MGDKTLAKYGLLHFGPIFDFDILRDEILHSSKDFVLRFDQDDKGQREEGGLGLDRRTAMCDLVGQGVVMRRALLLSPNYVS